MYRVSVVILNWNGRDYLEKFLPPLIKFSCDKLCEIVVADNGSTDESINMLKDKFPSVRIIEFDKNHGYASGYNLAIEQIDSEYVILLNSDIEVTEGWLAPLIEVMDSDETIGAAMPKIRSYNSPHEFEYAGASGGFIDILGYPFCRGRILSKVEEDRGQYDNRCEIFWATGACMITRTKLFIESGGFDPDFFAHQEEIDLCWRLKLYGYKVFVEPSSVVYHIGGGTLSSESPRKTYLNFRNNLWMLYKNLSTNLLFPVLATRLVLDGLSAFVFLLQGKSKHFKAVFSAHIAFYRALGELRKKRRIVKNMRVTKSSPTKIYNGSIVLNYYMGNDEFAKVRKNSDLCQNVGST